MPRIASIRGFVTLLTPFLLAAPDTAHGQALDGAAAFRARHGTAWSVHRDPDTGRVRRITGGATPWLAPGDPAAADPAVLRRQIEGLARRFLTEEASLLQLDAGAFRLPPDAFVIARQGRLVVAHLEQAPHGIPVLGSRASFAISHGNLVAVHVVASEPVATRPDARVAPSAAWETARAASGLPSAEVHDPEPPRLVFLPEGGRHRLAWEIWLHAASRPLRLRALVDANSGELLSLTNQTVSACTPVPAGGTRRRVIAGVRPERADEPERQELLEGVEVAGSVSGPDGTFAPPPPLYAAALAGPFARTDCVDCAAPATPFAAADSRGEIDFGAGGVDEIGNGRATPADRAAFFHLHAVRRQAARWLDLPFFSRTLRIRTNIGDACNAYWDGRGVNFFRSSARCGNTGEIRDVVAHEWGHGLDQFDGLRSSPLEVDGATGEAVADIVAILRSRDPCIGESFVNDPVLGPSDTCSGVRDCDELAPGHERGAPGTIGTGNVVDLCPPSGFYRGPLGREGHCEGEIFGQAFWHLVQNLVTGRAYVDGTPLGAEPLGEEQAWQVAESLFYTSRPLLASYAPSSLQDIGTSAYDAFLIADDEGDGVANGTPHAAAIHEAFAHHGMAESPVAPSDSPDCLPPPDPDLTLGTLLDDESGLPVAALTWTDVSATAYHLLRADDDGDGFLPLTPRGGTTDLAFLDRGVLPGRAYTWLVLAESADGCLSPGARPLTSGTGAHLVIDDLRLDDAPPGGNGDGRLEEGETAAVWVDLRNDGTSDLTGLTVSLDGSVAELTVPGPVSIPYPNLPPGGRAAAPAPFQVQLGAGGPRHAFLVASAEGDQGCARDEHVIELATRDLALHRELLLDPPPGGNDDGHWAAGETVLLEVHLRNDGLLDAVDVTGVLAFRGAPPAGVTIVDSDAGWGSVPSGGVPVPTIDPHFSLAADAGTPARTLVPLRLDVSIGGAFHGSHDVDLVVGPFPPAQHEWTLDSLEETWSTPVVIPLEDGDGDGEITGCDPPAIVCFGLDREGRRGVFAVRADGSEIWRWTSTDCDLDPAPCTLPQASPAAGDIDGDGLNEVLVVGRDNRLTALRSDGSVAWRTEDSLNDSGGTAPQIWDLDADGDVEIVAGGTVLDGRDGSVLWEAPVLNFGRVLVADLDLDGRQEIMFAAAPGGVRRHDGTEYPMVEPLEFERHGGVVNLDDDREPEIVVTHDLTFVTARNHDGTLVFQRDDIPHSISASPPCMADFDGDGRAEIVFPTDEALHALDDDGSDLWVSPRDGISGLYAGCSLFDFDGNGAPEIVYRDHHGLSIYDSRDGTELWQVDGSSATIWEIPVTADVDADGSAEIVVTYTSVTGVGVDPTLHVYGHPAWLPARAVWNQDAYSVTNVHDDGSIPVSPAPRWLAGNDFKAQAPPCDCAVAVPEIRVTVPDCDEALVCVEPDPDVDPDVEIEWDFGDGTPPVRERAPCHAYAETGDHVVRMTLIDAFGCLVSAAEKVETGPPLRVDYEFEPACAGQPWCFSALVEGGVEPVALAWDFGDGTPLEEGGRVCHVLPDRPTSVTLFARDAHGCLAEVTKDLDMLARPAPVGAVLYGIAHGDPEAPDITGTFAWTGDLGAPRPPEHHYHLFRSTDPRLLFHLPETEPWPGQVWTDSTPKALRVPHVHFYKVHAADECDRQSLD